MWCAWTSESIFADSDRFFRWRMSLPVAAAPLPASICGLLLLYLALSLNIVKLDQIKKVGNFLLSIMAVMFVWPAVGLLDCWDAIWRNMESMGMIILVSTALTFCVTGKVTQRLIKRKEKKEMGEFIDSNTYLGLVITISAFAVGRAIQSKWKISLLNPILIITAIVIAFCSPQGYPLRTIRRTVRHCNTCSPP